mgnify:CR=1 FL=1
MSRVRRDDFTNIEFKTCQRCDNELHVSKYNRNKANRDGYQYQCAMCQSETVKESRKRTNDRNG